MDTDSIKTITDSVASNTIILAILSSTLLGAFVASIVNGIFSIKLKKRDYQYVFFQEVIKKRMDAYEFIEMQIAVLKHSAVDNDGKAYHLIFAYTEEKFYEYQQNLALAISKGVWISNETNRLLTELNHTFLKIGLKYNLKNSLENAGKDNYVNIADLRVKLEASFAKDFLTLHDVEAFLLCKEKAKPSYSLVDIEREN